MELKTKLRRFGNSFGVIIPSDLVKTRGFREGEDVSITIEGEGWTAREVVVEARRRKLGRKFKLPTQGILDKLDEEIDSS